MKDLDIKELLIDYLDKNLSKEMQAKVEQLLMDSEEARNELSAYSELMTEIKKDPKELPSKNLRQRFEEVLEEEKQETKVLRLPSRNLPKMILKYAAGFAILLSAFMLGKFQQDNDKPDVLAMKQATMLALMENESASKRIQGVHFIEEFSDPDPEIVEALIKRMLNDDNANVRLTAVTALEAFITAESVKDGFIQALDTEKDPSIQISIIKALIKIQEKKALKPMQKLLEKEDTQLFVKDEIKTVLTNI